MTTIDLTASSLTRCRSISITRARYLPGNIRISAIIHTEIRIFLRCRCQTGINGILKTCLFKRRTPFTNRLNDALLIHLRELPIYIEDDRMHRFHQFSSAIPFSILRTNFQPPTLNDRKATSDTICRKHKLVDFKKRFSVTTFHRYRLFRHKTDTDSSFPNALIILDWLTRKRHS